MPFINKNAPASPESNNNGRGIFVGREAERAFFLRCNALSKKVTIKGAKNRQGAKLSKSQSLTEPLNQISVA